MPDRVPKLGFRVDIDTEPGLRRGVPALLDLARDLAVRMSFFVNMGRMWSFRRVLDRARGPDFHGDISLGERFGKGELVRNVLRNPYVGGTHPDILARILDDGHELGLHGGRNHGRWHHGGEWWTVDEAEEEIAWGIDAMERIGLLRPRIFSSPGLRGSRNINSALVDLGFRLVCDRHEGDEAKVSPVDGSLLGLSTSRLGSRKGVGLVEHLLVGNGLQGDGFSSVTSRVRRIHRGVIYDHPVIAGGVGLDTTRRLVESLSNVGVEWLTLSDLADDLQGEKG